MRTLNLKSDLPDLETARRRLLAELEAARRGGTAVLKVIHGWGSGGTGGVLCAGIRKSLRLRVAEGRARAVVTGERFSADTNEGRDLVARHPALRRDPDFNRANPGITVVELAPLEEAPGGAPKVSGAARTR